MLEMTHDGLTVKVVEQGSVRLHHIAAFITDATESQRESLGKAAVGQAWTVWYSAGSWPITIKFMPPSQLTDKYREHLGRSYRLALRLADTNEASSAALPLPGMLGIKGMDDAMHREICQAVLESCAGFRYLTCVVLIAKENSEIERYARCLRDVKKAITQAAKGPA